MLRAQVRTATAGVTLTENRSAGAFAADRGSRADLAIYLAGADPYREDQLGGLKLSLHGLEHRDRLVFEKARAKKIPVAVALAGGYARHLNDTVRIHANTIRVAREFGKG